MGLVDDPELSAYVRAIGARLAANSPRQDTKYEFRVVDMPEANAFALPGGYIYVSRGLLTLCNSEEELANVMGHEVGHVAARHSAQRETRAAGAGLLTALGTILAGAYGGAEAAQTVGQIGQVAGAGLIASYGRDQERQADSVGQRLSARSGWDPHQMSTFLRTLEADGRLAHGNRAPSFFDSHPATPERVGNTAALAGTLVRAATPPIARNRADFLRRIRGIMVGPNPAEGVVDGSSFLHVGMDFRMKFPDGWNVQNGRS
ncbi:MAG: M48 family metalloprotease, partial [bacterium]|nr:M48 family metalloprotease [bacterium]